MRRAWPVAILAVIAAGVIFDASSGSSSGPRLGIAYVRGGPGSASQVWLSGPDGRGARRLGPGAQPLLSPSGESVAVSSGQGSGAALLLYPSDGSRARGFFDVTRATASPQAWSPDSRYLAVALLSTDPLSDRASGLAVIDTQNSSYRIVAHGAIYGASFAPDGSDRLAYARGTSAALSARVDLHVIAPDGGGARAVTHDGRSLYPVWGPRSIAFAHERLRRGAAPVYQLWTMQPDGSHPFALTSLRVPPLINGLVPIAFSGDWLLAEYEGQNTSVAWAVSVARRSAHPLTIRGHSVSGSGLSRDGSIALVDAGGFLNPPDQGAVSALRLTGGAPKQLVAHGSQPSWNR